MTRHFFIIGAGLGAEELLTGEAARAIIAADHVLTTTRLAEQMSPLRTDIAICETSELATRALSAEVATVAILVSGDTGFFSAASGLYEVLSPYGKTMLLPGISSLQYFCARLGTRYHDAALRSFHGRPGAIIGAVCYHHKVFTLTGGARKASDLCRELVEAGLGGVRVSLGENLGSDKERIVRADAAAVSDMRCGDLVVLLIENDSAVNAHVPVSDAMLVRGNVPMTKEEVRWVSVAKLAVQQDDVVWDIGAGTGSVSIELARKACDGVVYAVERKPEAVALLHQNRIALGAYNVTVVEGAAPEALEELPVPDAAFIGGSGGRMKELLSQLHICNPKVRIVVNAIALETVHEALTAMHALGFAHIEVTQLFVSRGHEVGAYTMMMANNPIFILSGGGE